MPHPTARATIFRLVRALYAVSASPSTPAAGTPLHSLSAEHAAARSPSALEGPVTRATHRHPLLLPRPLCANAAPHRCSRSACSAVRQAHASHPHSTVQTSLVPVRHLTINTSLFFLFLFSVMFWLRMPFTRTYCGFTGICELRFEHEMTSMLLHREMLGGFAHFLAKEQNLNFVICLQLFLASNIYF